MTNERGPNGSDPVAGVGEPSLAGVGAPAAAGVGDPAVAGGGEAELDVEVVDGLPVLAEVRTIERVTPASLPAVQAAAAAATGFVAGAATVALVKRRTARKLARARGPRRAADMLSIAATRSFLVDVHVIGKQSD